MGRDEVLAQGLEHSLIAVGFGDTVDVEQQEGELERVGGSKTIKVDVRVIAATNRDLEAEVRQGRFREDLFYRLDVFRIPIPPLRERLEDVPLLLRHFVRISNERLGTRISGIVPGAMQVLLAYRWPGNVREMQNLIERMVILAESDHLTLNDLPPNMALAAPPFHSPAMGKPTEMDLPRTLSGDSLEAIERREIEASLKRNGWVQVRAARELGLTQRQIGYRIKKYGLSRYDSFRG